MPWAALALTPVLGVLDRLRTDPVGLVRRLLQFFVLWIMVSWVVLAFWGRKLASEGEPEAEREFDVSEWVDKKLGDSMDTGGNVSDSNHPTGGEGSTQGGTPASNRALGHQMIVAAFGSEKEWQCADDIITPESGWDHTAENPDSHAYGIPQRNPQAHGPTPTRFKNSPKVQIQWFINYVKTRYGTPCKALAFRRANGYY